MAKLKVFDTYPSKPGARNDITDLLTGEDLRHPARQVSAYVLAESRAQAVEYLSGAGVHVDRVADVRIGLGNDLDALREAGLLDTPGDVVVANSSRADAVVLCRMEPGHDPEIAGEFVYDHAVRERVFRRSA